MMLAPSAIRRLLMIVAFAASIAAMIGPAIFNGFPLVYNDTGTYLHGAFSFEVAPDRPIFYSLVVAALQPWAPWGLWPVVVVQGMLATFVLSAVLAHFRGAAAAPGVVGLAAALTPLTALPWFVSQIMPDIFAPLLVLCFFLLASGQETLSGKVRWGLVAVAALAMAVHSSHLLLGLALLFAAFAARRLRGNPLSLRLPVVALVVAVIAGVATNYALTKEIYLARSGPLFLLSRLVQDGIAGRFLNEVCPSPDYRLCDFSTNLPKTADQFLWDDTRALNRMGGWNPESIDEAKRIIRETLIRYPGMHLAKAAESFGRQLMNFRTGEGLTPNYGPPLGYLQKYMPDWVPVYERTLQQQGLLDFRSLNLIHLPAGAIGQVFLILALIFARDTMGAHLTRLFGFIAVGLVANAFICGVLSNPNDRYQSRIVWLVVLAVALAMIARLAGPKPAS